MNENEGLGALTAKLAEAISENNEDQKSSLSQEPAPTPIVLERDRDKLRLEGRPFMVGTVMLVGLLVVNVYLFQPYLTSILFAWAVSIPLRPVKDTIVSFLVEGLQNQEEAVAFDFVTYHLLRVVLYVLFGEQASNWFFERVSPFLYPTLKLSDSPPALKLRPVEDQVIVGAASIQPPLSPKPGSTHSEPVENDVSRELSKDSTTSSKKPSPKSNTILKAKLKPLFGYFQRADWYYLIMVIRICTAYSLGNYFIVHKAKLVLGLGLIYGGSTLTSESNFPSVFSKVKGAFSSIHSMVSTLKHKSNRFILASVDSAVVSMLMVGIVGGIVFGSYTFYNALVSEIQGGMRYYLLGAIKFMLAQATKVVDAIAFNSSDAPHHIKTAQEYLDSFLMNQLQLNTTATEVAKYVSTPDFAEWMALKAPVTWGFMQGSAEKGLERLTDSTFLTSLGQELQSVIQPQLSIQASGLSADVSTYAPLVALPVISAIPGLASGGLGMLVPVMLGFFDSIFQVVVFAVVLSGLLAQKESPVEPARRILCKAWGDRAADFEYRLANRIEEQISGICLFTVQMGVFHFLLTWISLHLVNAPGPNMFALLSGIIAVIPIGGPYLGALPPVMIMWHGERRYVASLVLFVSQVAVALVVDSNFYAHLPTVSSFFIALAAFLGHAVLGLKGILVGPLVLSMVPVLYSEFLVDTSEKLPNEMVI